MIIIEVEDRTISLTRQLLSIWEGSVRLTHTFLSESEIERIKAYVQDAIGKVAHLVVTVNEQNPLAIGFYKHLGFRTYMRTDLDEEGNPYPLLYMSLQKNKKGNE